MPERAGGGCNYSAGVSQGVGTVVRPPEIRGCMDELIIRFGATEGPRNPTALDIRKALEDIESGVRRRPEFTIENVSNWKPALIDGRRVIRCVSEGRWISAATLYREDSETALGWVVFFQDEIKKSYALSSNGSRETEFLEGICCGGPSKICASCVVSLDAAHAALTYFAQCRDRSPIHEWLPRADVQRFD